MSGSSSGCGTLCWLSGARGVAGEGGGGGDGGGGGGGGDGGSGVSVRGGGGGDGGGGVRDTGGGCDDCTGGSEAVSALSNIGVASGCSVSVFANCGVCGFGVETSVGGEPYEMSLISSYGGLPYSRVSRNSRHRSLQRCRRNLRITDAHPGLVHGGDDGGGSFLALSMVPSGRQPPSPTPRHAASARPQRGVD